jgi:hypothetical protein
MPPGSTYTVVRGRSMCGCRIEDCILHAHPTRAGSTRWILDVLEFAISAHIIYLHVVRLPVENTVAFLSVAY